MTLVVAVYCLTVVGNFLRFFVCFCTFFTDKTWLMLAVHYNSTHSPHQRKGTQILIYGAFSGGNSGQIFT